jgi:short-subunit dehydrogenase
MDAWVKAVDTEEPLDLLFACAGVAEAPLGVADDICKASHLVTAVNVTGVINTVTPIIPGMRTRRRGQIAIVASLSGFMSSWPRYPTYAASKAWARSWGTGLRGHLWDDGVRVSVVAPGFVQTPMTDERHLPPNSPRLPGLVTVDAAARRIVQGLLIDEAIITFPAWMLTLSTVMSYAPLALVDFFGRHGAHEFAWGKRAVAPAHAR